MPKMINPIEKIKNEMHNSVYNAKSRAENNGVYICKSKEKKEFEFIPLEHVLIKGVTLEEYIQAQKDELQLEINSLNQAVATLKELVNSLSEHIDKQRFL